MRISRIEVHSNGRHQVTLNISELRHKTPYVVKAISGLDVTEVASRFYGFSHLVGEDGRRVAYHAPVLPPREIAMRVGFRPNYENYGARSKLRDELYRLLGSTRNNEVELRFFNEAEAVMNIKGKITRNEASLFTEESEMIVTVLCNDPMFRSMAEFLYEDPHTTVKANVRAIKLFDKESTAQHGCLIELTMAAACNELIIDTVQTDNVSRFHLDVSSGFLLNNQPFTTFAVGDILTVDTRDALPILTLSRGALKANLMDKVVHRSVWPLIHYGENVFEIHAIHYKNGRVAPPTIGEIRWVSHFVGV